MSVNEYQANYELGIQVGAAQEREALAKLLLARICGEYLKTNYCPHGACEDLRNAVTVIKDRGK